MGSELVVWAAASHLHFNGSAAKQHVAPHPLLLVACEAPASCSLTARCMQLPCKGQHWFTSTPFQSVMQESLS